MSDKFERLKTKHRLQMEGYEEEVREYIDQHSNDNCDYLIHRRLMESYHRGAWNALNEAEQLESSMTTI